MAEVVCGRWRTRLLPWIAVAIAALATLALPSLASATPTASTGDISGAVTVGGSGTNGLTVFAYPAGTDPLPDLLQTDGNGSSQAIAETVTTGGAAGSYDLSGLAPGAYTVIALPTATDGYLATFSNGVTSFTSAATVTVTADATTSSTNVALVDGATVTGTITNSSNTGVGGVSVSLKDAGGNTVDVPVSDGTGSAMAVALTATTATTGTVGSYSIAGVPGGTDYDLFVNGSGAPKQNYADVWYLNAATQAGATAINPTNGESFTASQTLSNAGTITGTVDNGTASYTAGGRVLAFTTAGGEFVGSANISTSTGTYTINHLAPGSYDLEFVPLNTGATFWATGWYGGSGLVSAEQAGTAVAVSAGGTATATTFSAVTGGTISGLVSGNGAPAGGIVVQLYDSNGNALDDDTGYGEAETNDDGSYTLGDAVTGFPMYYLPGSYKVGFSVVGDGANLGFQYYDNVSTLASAATVTVAGGGANTPNINAALTTGGTMTGTVTVASSGAPAAGVGVDVEDAGGNVLQQTVTAPDGTYSLSGLAAGTYYVEFVPTSSTLQTQYYGDKQVLAGSSPVSITAGQTTANINAALGSITTPGQTTTVVTTQTVPAAIPAIAGTVPAVTGTAKVGFTLTAKTGVWTAGTKFTYQWYAGGKAIAGATGPTLRLAAGQYRKVVTVAVTGAESGFYSTAKTSAATKAVAAGTLAAKVPTITGTAKVGDKLTAKPGVWTAGTKFTYQWYANGKAIKGATKSTFKLVAAEKGKKITVRVTGKLTGYTTVAKSSKATAKVA